MTDAGHVRERLSAYLDAELDAVEAAALAAHLDACETCGAEFAALRAAHRELLRAEVPTQPDAYWRSFRARVEARLPIAPADSVPAGAAAWPGRIVRWFVPAGHLAWGRAAAAVASVTLLAYVGINVLPETATRQQRASQASRSRAITKSPAETTPAPTVPAQTPPAEGILADADVAGAARIDAAAPLAVGRTGAIDDRVVAPKKERTDAPLLPGASADTAAEEQAADRKLPAAPPTQSVADLASRANEAPEREAHPQDVAESIAGEGSGIASVDRAVTDVALAQRRDRRVDSLLAEQPAADEAIGAPLRIAAPRSAAPRDVVSEQVLAFVTAALANDVDAADAARRELEPTTPAATEAVGQMQIWSRARAPEAKSSVTPEARALNLAPAPATALAPDVRALDLLVWPRRHEPAFAPVVEQLARALEAASAQSPELRPRAREYYEALADGAQTEADRARWRARMDALAR